MKSNKHSKKDFKHSNIEKNDIGNPLGKGIKKDRSAKRRLSIYDEFEEESFDDLDFKSENKDSFDEEEDY